MTLSISTSSNSTSSQQTLRFATERPFSTIFSSQAAPVRERMNRCCVHIGAEDGFHFESEQVANCLRTQHITVNKMDPSSATHSFLFITGSFFKSKELILPLITRFVVDPDYNQRLFPVLMGQNIGIFGSSSEVAFTEYWSSQLQTLPPGSGAYSDVKAIVDNIGPFIRMLRDILMPPLGELLDNNLSAITGLIEQRAHLLRTKHFFFLPSEASASPIGLEALLVQLALLFANQPIVYLSGEAGMGKTTLAIEHARRFQPDASGVFWLDASSEQSLEQSFQELATQLGIDRFLVIGKLKLMKNFLLIYDNVANLSLIPDIPAARTLIVGRELPNPDIIIREFSPEDAAHYISSQLDAPFQEAQLFADLLKYHPALLVSAVAYIKSAKLSIQQYTEYYSTDKENLFIKQRESLRPAQIKGSHPRRADLDSLQPSQHTIDRCQILSDKELAQQLKEQEVQIFLSYCWTPSTDSADRIDTVFKALDLDLIRDVKGLRKFEGVQAFMKKVIRDGDYVVSLVNDEYLKSFNCLFEVVRIMDDPCWMQRIFPIVVPGNAPIAHSSTYRDYWIQRVEQFQQSGSDIEIDTAKRAAEKVGITWTLSTK